MIDEEKDAPQWLFTPRNLKGAGPCQQGACKQPEVLHALLGRLRTSDSAEVRLLAAQSVRRHAPKHWRRLSSQVCVPGGLLPPAPLQHPLFVVTR